MSAEAQQDQKIIITRKEYMASGDELYIPGVPLPSQSKEYHHAKREAHRIYFGQFVTPQTVRTVARYFEPGELAAALKKDENLNSIPLETWDRLTWHPTNERPSASQYTSARGASGPFQSHMPVDDAAIEAAGEWVTRSTLVCIAKQAARMLVEQEQEKSNG